MLLGKRQRPPMKRTTSMTEFTLDLDHTIVVDDDDDKSLHHPNTTMINNNMTTMIKPPLSPTVTTTSRIHRRNSADHNQIPHFLTACHLCKRRLINGHDIFMYRGDSAFCSLECRQQQMNQDEKCSMSPKKHNASTTSPNASETVAAM